MSGDDFLKLSCVLTGEKKLDGARGERFRVRLTVHYGDLLTSFVNAFKALPNSKESDVRALLEREPQYNVVARAIVWVWYTGQFKTAYELDDAPQTPDEYAAGLLWKVIRAHPPGFKAGGFGSWAKQP